MLLQNIFDALLMQEVFFSAHMDICANLLRTCLGVYTPLMICHDFVRLLYRRCCGELLLVVVVHHVF